MAELKTLNLPPKILDDSISKVLAKTCLCEDLAAGALIKNSISNKRSLNTAVCPGPNLAYFSKLTTLKDMVCHIYGRVNILNSIQRSHMFINELRMYLDYFKKEINKLNVEPTSLEIKYLNTFKENLNNGINYYQHLIPKLIYETVKCKDQMKKELSDISDEFNQFIQISFKKLQLTRI